MFFVSDSQMTTKKFSEEPEFERPIGNHTFFLGREAILGCAVTNLAKHKVSIFSQSYFASLSLRQKCSDFRLKYVSLTTLTIVNVS